MSINPLPVWTVTLSAEVQKATKLTDFGVFPLQRWLLTGRCSYHGPQSLTIETTEFLGDDVLSGYVSCGPCGKMGIKRLCPIQTSRLLKEGEA